MKIYILADMEGISGIRTLDQVKFDSPEYAEGRKLMMDDINAAIDAAYRAGATEVVACDTHGGGGQVKLAEMDPRAVYETPNGWLLMPSLDASFAGVVLLGHHARAGTLNAFLDHTMSSASWFEYRINGQVVGEIGIEAAYAGPLRRARDHGLRRRRCGAGGAGITRPCGMRGRQVGHPAQPGQVPVAARSPRGDPRGHEPRHRLDRRLSGPINPALPATVRLTLYRTDMADEFADDPHIERVDARTVQRQAFSLLDVCRW